MDFESYVETVQEKLVVLRFDAKLDDIEGTMIFDAYDFDEKPMHVAQDIAKKRAQFVLKMKYY